MHFQKHVWKFALTRVTEIQHTDVLKADEKMEVGGQP